jgi:hypothetical protein
MMRVLPGTKVAPLDAGFSLKRDSDDRSIMNEEAGLNDLRVIVRPKDDKRINLVKRSI